MSVLAFLKGITLEEVAKSERTGGGVKKDRNPAEDFMGIRIWKDGSVFPSAALVKEFNLEYPKATITAGTTSGGKEKKVYEFPNGAGFGFDVIDSRDWIQYKGEQHFVAVAITAKDEPKVDLFASTKYKEDGTPFATVLEQGAATFGKTMLPVLFEVYGVEPNKEGFIDLQVETSMNLKSLSSNGIFLFPKVTSRGEHKGKADHVRRENCDMFAITPVEDVTDSEVPEPPQEGNAPVALDQLVHTDATKQDVKTGA